MQLTSETLDALLELLASHDVKEFAGMGFHVKFQPKTPEVTEMQSQESQESDRPAPVPTKSQWENPGLWPGGKPPGFPGMDK